MREVDAGQTTRRYLLAHDRLQHVRLVDPRAQLATQAHHFFLYQVVIFNKFCTLYDIITLYL